MGKRIALLAGLLIACVVPMKAVDMGENAKEVYGQGVLGLTFLALAILFGGVALYFEYQNRYRGKRSFLNYALQNRIVRILLACVALVLFVRIFMGDQIGGLGRNDLEFAKSHKMHQKGTLIYHDLIQQYPFIPEYHHGFVTAYYAADDWYVADWDPGLNGLNFPPPQVYYSIMAQFKTSTFRQMGLLGLGMTMYYDRRYSSAEEVLLEIPAESLPYRNLYLGRISMHQGLPLSAEEYFRMELAIGGERRWASIEMAELVDLFYRADTVKLREMVEDSVMGPYATPILGQNLYIRSGEMGKYAATIFQKLVSNVNWVGFLASAVGLLFWSSFLRRLDPLGKMKRWAMASVLGASALFCLLALPAGDYVEYVVGLQPTGELWMDLLYEWLAVGVVEEFVKFVPLLLIWRSTKLINSPLAFIVFASLSGLGFAFVENYMVYFTQGNESAIHSRLLITVFVHMFCSSLIAYGIVLAKYKYKKWMAPITLLAFFGASLFHALFNFFLTNPSTGLSIFTSYGLFLFASFQYGAFLNNALNNDPEFNPRRLPASSKITFFLLAGLVGLLMFEFLAIAILYGGGVAIRELFQNLALGSFVIFFLAANLSNLDIVKGEWFWLRPWNLRTHQDYNQPIGQRLRLRPHSPNSVLQGMLPATGEVVARVRIRGKSHYYVFRFDKPVLLLGHPILHVLICASDPEERIEPGFQMEVSLIAYRNEEALTKKDQTKRDFRHLDMAIVE